MKVHLSQGLWMAAVCLLTSLPSPLVRADVIGPPTAHAPAAEAAVVGTLRCVPISQVLPGPRAGLAGIHPFGGAPVGNLAARPHAGHVIDLLLRANVLEQFAAHAGRPLPIAAPFGAPVCGDLQLLSVALMAEATPACGPTIAVTFQNSSTVPVRRFSISAVAVLGAIDFGSPTVMARVPEVAPGATATIEMQLPATAMAMTPDGQNLAPFDTLVVALDSFDELVEADELNNIAILRRAEMVLVAPAAAAVEAGEAGPAPSAAVSAEAAPPSVAITPTPNDNAVPAPDNKIDFDQLELEDAEASALFIRR